MFRVNRRVRCGVGRGGKYAIAGAILSAVGSLGITGHLYAEDVFEPTIDSPRAYECPEWFRDAKFGIYVHWGPTSVPAVDGWYARNMYIEGHRAYQFHLKTYGHPSEFGYKDIIPLWKAEHFDPDRLVALFKRAGAKYFTPCAVHHDNFDLWDSKHHQWNSVNRGPKKDITGMWRKAALKHGLRFGVTTHLARSYSWFNTNKGKDKEGPHAGVPYDGNDPKYQDLYFEPHDDTDLRHPRNPPESWRKNWALRIKDLIDRYQPDHIYFDGAIPFLGEDNGKTGLEVIAYYYNQNRRWHNGRQEGMLCIKRIANHGIYVDGVATIDFERTRAKAILPKPWQTDTSVGPWFYRRNIRYRSATSIIHELIDIVSKNGNLLLNVPPAPDGTLDQGCEDVLLSIGMWLDVNGEAIYGTRPWKQHEEQDVHFTTKGDTLYAIALEWPKGELVIKCLGSASVGKTVGSVRLLGHDAELDFEQSGDGLKIKLPSPNPCKHAYAFEIEFGKIPKD